MIKQATVHCTKSTDPYLNLALEELLLQKVKDAECILYLWQNAHTVVIGKNQNAWKECKVEALSQDQGHLVRRLSGGGAVYHDLGNLNFTFLVHQKNYDVQRQCSIIQLALKKLGIDALVSGRNDITVDGRKISGNAFYRRDERCYHHGTLLVNVDTKKMQKYLNPSIAKLQSKGVDSVRARVANLVEFKPDLTIEELQSKLIEAFEEVVGYKAKQLDEARIDKLQLMNIKERITSYQWCFGPRLPFQKKVDKRFVWGGIEIQMQLNEGVIKDTQIYCDAMELDWLEQLKTVLLGCPFQLVAIQRKIESIPCFNDLEKQMQTDIIKCFMDEEE